MINTPSVRQETLIAPTGAVANFTDAFNADIGFDTLSIAVDNFTGYYLFLEGAANPYIPPWWVGVVRNVIHAPTRIKVQWASPFGGPQNPAITGSLANVTFTNYILPYAPGSLAGAPPNPNNPPGPPPINITIDPADVTVIAQAICDCIVAPVINVSCGDLLSTRLQVFEGTQPAIAFDTPIIWDIDPDFNDLNFVPADWNSLNGVFNILTGMDGDYLITAYAQLDPATTGSSMDLIISTFASGDPGNLNDEHQTVPNDTVTRPKASVSSVHRFYAGGFFQINIRCSGAQDAQTILYASVTITKLRSIVPLP